MVITGMGLVSVFGNDVDVYYERLLAGESGVGAIDRFDASGFPTRFAAQIRGFSSEGYVDGKLDRRLDDIHRYALVATKKALECASLAPGTSAMEKVDKERAGVFVGSGMGGITAFSDGANRLTLLRRMVVCASAQAQKHAGGERLFRRRAAQGHQIPRGPPRPQPRHTRHANVGHATAKLEETRR